MSGGSFDYKQYCLNDIADDIRELIDINNSKELDEYGYPIGRGYSPDTITHFITAERLLRVAYIYAQRIDWLVSGDDGEDDFHKRLKEDLDEESLYSPSV